MFLALIGLKSAGVVVGNQATLVGLGDLTKAGPLLAIAGFFIIAVLDALKVRGAILIGILIVTVASIALGISQFGGVFSAPPSLAPTFLQLDVMGALHTGILHVILVFVLVEVFDATGTLIGVAKRGGLIEPGKPNRLGRALLPTARQFWVVRFSVLRPRRPMWKAHPAFRRGPYRLDGTGRSTSVSCGLVHFPARWFCSSLRDGTGPYLRRLPDDA